MKVKRTLSRAAASLSLPSVSLSRPVPKNPNLGGRGVGTFDGATMTRGARNFKYRPVTEYSSRLHAPSQTSFASLVDMAYLNFMLTLTRRCSIIARNSFHVIVLFLSYIKISQSINTQYWNNPHVDDDSAPSLLATFPSVFKLPGLFPRRFLPPRAPLTSAKTPEPFCFPRVRAGLQLALCMRRVTLTPLGFAPAGLPKIAR